MAPGGHAHATIPGSRVEYIACATARDGAQPCDPVTTFQKANQTPACDVCKNDRNQSVQDQVGRMPEPHDGRRNHLQATPTQKTSASPDVRHYFFNNVRLEPILPARHRRAEPMGIENARWPEGA